MLEEKKINYLGSFCWWTKFLRGNLKRDYWEQTCLRIATRMRLQYSAVIRSYVQKQLLSAELGKTERIWFFIRLCDLLYSRTKSCGQQQLE